MLIEVFIFGKVDYLGGLKENVIMGRLILVGIGYDFYWGVRIQVDELFLFLF